MLRKLLLGGSLLAVVMLVGIAARADLPEQADNDDLSTPTSQPDEVATTQGDDAPTTQDDADVPEAIRKVDVPVDDTAMLALLVKTIAAEGGYNSKKLLNLDAETSATFTPVRKMSAGDRIKMRKHIKDGFEQQGHDIGPMVEQLFLANTHSQPVGLTSSTKDGYQVKSRAKAPAIEVSRLIWDRKTDLVLVYIGTNYGPMAGGGGVYLYQFQYGKLTRVAGVVTWMS